MSALAAFVGLTREGRSRSRRWCWGGEGEREPSGAKTSSTFTNNAPTPSARAPIQSRRLHGRREARSTRGRSSSAVPGRLTSASARRRGAPQPTRDAATACRAGSRLGLPALHAGDHGPAGCAPALGAPGPHPRRHLVPALRRRTGRAVCASCVPSPSWQLSLRLCYCGKC